MSGTSRQVLRLGPTRLALTKIKRIRKHLYEILVEKKDKGGLGYKAKFTFKWIPDLLHASTPLGSQNEARRKDSGPFKHGGIERPALVMLVMMAVSLGYVAYLIGGWAVAPSLGLENICYYS